MLVVILLTLELLFVGSLSIMVGDAEKEALRQAHSKEIVGTTNHIFQLFYDAGTAAAAFQQQNGGKENSDKYDAASAKIPEELEKLKALVKDDPQYVAAVEEVDGKSKFVLKVVNRIMSLAEHGQWPEALGLAVKFRDLYDTKKNQLLNELRELMNAQQKILDEGPKIDAHQRKMLKGLLLAGVALNVVFAIALALLFVRTITRRLDILVDNTQRLPKHLPLNQILRGSDEIAQLDQAFHQMAQQLKEVEEMKQQFVAMVSHDLRTPLTSVCGFLEMLRQGAYGDLSSQGSQRTQLAERNIQRLIALINDLLDMEKLESGQLELIQELIPLEPVITRSLDAVRVFAEQHKVQLVADPVDYIVYGDTNRLIQVLVNLVSNAVKFSPPDSAVTVAAVPIDDFIEVRIIDKGRGVPAAYREVIFERFRQVKATDATQKGGTGLGLAICKAIVEQHGGKIGVESEEGKGSTFWFRVPLKPMTVKLSLPETVDVKR
jgi:signal transduction histidine kinase